jgi:zinc transport system substrate-binding protein
MSKKIIIIIGVVVLLCIGVVLAVVVEAPKLQSKGIKVSTSFYPLYFFAKQIGMDRADVNNITPAGAEPHDYEPTGQDIAQIEKSKLLILNGLLEPWADSIKTTLDSNTKVITISDGIVKKGGLDSHIWLNPVLAKEMVDKIAQGFIEVDAENKAYYQANADILKTKLDDLDKEFKQGLSNCTSKSIVTSHAAFGYLANAYGLQQVSIAGFSPGAEPSAKQLADVARFVKANNIKYIFFESLVSPKLSDTIAKETGATTLVLDPIEGLSDVQISAGEDYFTKMRENLNNLMGALHCFNSNAF